MKTNNIEKVLANKLQQIKETKTQTLTSRRYQFNPAPDVRIINSDTAFNSRIEAQPEFRDSSASSNNDFEVKSKSSSAERICDDDFSIKKESKELLLSLVNDDITLSTSIISMFPHLLNEKDFIYGNTPLHWAVRLDCSEFASFLVSQNANTNITNNIGLTPLHMAVIENNQKLCKIILSRSYTDTGVMDFTFRTAFDYVTKDSHEYIQKKLQQKHRAPTIILERAPTKNFKTATHVLTFMKRMTTINKAPMKTPDGRTMFKSVDHEPTSARSLNVKQSTFDETVFTNKTTK